jgi:hypothetical protein
MAFFKIVKNMDVFAKASMDGFTAILKKDLGMRAR